MVAVVGFHVKHMFLDRPNIARRIERGKLAGLKKAGAMVRKQARQLLGRKTKGKSKRTVKGGRNYRSIGPPRTRSSGLNLKTIYFIYDGKKMIVGPVKFPTDNNSESPEGVPGVLEHGKVGSVTVFKKTVNSRARVRKRAKWRKRKPRTPEQQAENRFEKEKKRVRFLAQYKKRPFMAPALKMKKSQFPALFRNVVK